MHIPQGFSTLTPYLSVDQAAGYVRFLTNAFGAIELGRTESDAGLIAHCQVRIGDSVMMLSDAVPQCPPTVSALYLFVEDADAAVTRAVSAGAVAIMDVADQPYGDRQGGVRDLAGNTWWISQRLTAAPYY